MGDRLEEIDLKSPFGPVPPPPSYYDAVQQPQPMPQSMPQPQSPQPNTYGTANPVGFSIPQGAQTYPQQIYRAGTYSPQTSPQTTYVVRPTVCPQDACAMHRRQRQRRVCFIVCVFFIVFGISMAFWAIFD
ncbi:hypothetical protein FO519_004591 [Halicephalobus sp. NKZ332]|nr:hypothetical protein FO519_004591 [Halicephalobus sp. NKZ332]